MARNLKQMKKHIADAEAYVDVVWKEEEAIPSIAGCALYMGVPQRTLRKWMDRSDANSWEPFPKLRDQLLAAQEVTLLTNGLRGTYTPTITKLVLHQHGYSDKMENDLTSSDGSMSKPDKILVVGKSCSDGNGDN